MQHTFHVTGMTCGHCERAVQQAIQAIDADAQVSIDRTAQQVVVQSEQASRAALAQAIADEGYDVA